MAMMQTQPYNKAAAVTPSNTADFLLGETAAVVASGAGNIAAVFPDNAVVVIALAAGQILPIKLKRINSTSTTATGITALYMI